LQSYPLAATAIAMSSMVYSSSCHFLRRYYRCSCSRFLIGGKVAAVGVIVVVSVRDAAAAAAAKQAS